MLIEDVQLLGTSVSDFCYSYQFLYKLRGIVNTRSFQYTFYSFSPKGFIQPEFMERLLCKCAFDVFVHPGTTFEFSANDRFFGRIEPNAAPTHCVPDADLEGW